MAHNVLDTHVSMFANAFQDDPIGVSTLRQILSDIKTGKYRGLIDRLRARIARGDMEGYEEDKKKLPAFTLSAQLKTRDRSLPLPEKLIAHTHMLQIDIDDVPGQIEFFEARLRNDPVILFFFRSPSGSSLKVGVRIDGTRHHDSYLSAEKYFLDEYKVKIDPKVKEVPRLCFVSCDPDPFVNENATILPISAAALIPPVRAGTSSRPTRKPSHAQRALDTAKKMIDRSPEGEKLNELLKASRLLGGYVSGHMLSRNDAESWLKTTIEQKAGVNNINTAYKAIADGLDYGEQTPFDFEDLERERLQYQRYRPTNTTNTTNTTDSTQHDTNTTETLQKHDKHDNQHDRNLQDAIDNLWGLIRKWVAESPGKFSSSELDKELGINSRVGKQNRSKCLSVLVSEGIIERDFNRRGVFRKKDNNLVEMDILGAKSEELPIDLPFGLSKEIEINEKEIILIMGETNTGKTSVIFNMIWSSIRTLSREGCLKEKKESSKERKENQKSSSYHNSVNSNSNANRTYGIRYFSSEMGPTGVRKKLLAFGNEYPIEEWMKYVVSVERNRDFQDVVDPYGLNFIDYLEVFDGEYFKLSSCLTSIHAALQTGIAVIALQKKRGTDIGRGGEATLEKPRLALALSDNLEKGYTTVKIVKAKHYRDRNPAGLEKDFVIRRHGTKIHEVSEWGYAKDHQVRRSTVDYHKLFLDDYYG